MNTLLSFSSRFRSAEMRKTEKKNTHTHNWVICIVLLSPRRRRQQCGEWRASAGNVVDGIVNGGKKKVNIIALKRKTNTYTYAHRHTSHHRRGPNFSTNTLSYTVHGENTMGSAILWNLLTWHGMQHHGHAHD